MNKDVMDAQFFPQGQDILYETDRLDLFVLHPNRTSESVIAKAADARISRDGKWLVYQKLNKEWQPGEYFDGTLGVAKLELASKVETLLTTDWEDFNPNWSPDGTTISFSSGRTHLSSVWLMDVDGKNQRQITNVGQESYDPDKSMTAPNHTPLWSADGRHLIYEADRKIWSLTLDTGRQKMTEAKQLAFGEWPLWVDDETVGVLAMPSNETSPKILKVRLNGNVVQ